MPERMLLVERDLDGHIDQDDQRWGLLLKLGALFGTTALGVIVSVIGWAFVTIHADQQKQLDYLTNHLPPTQQGSPRP